MNVLFTYNARLFFNEDGKLFGNEFNPTVIKRYNLRDCTVKLILRQKKLPIGGDRSIDPFKLEPGWKVEFVPDFNGFLSFVFNLKELKISIRKAVQESDFIIARVPSTISRIALGYAKKFNKPYLLEVVGDPWDALWNHSFKGKLLAPYAYLKMRSLVWNAPYVIYVTSKYLQSRYPNTNRNIGISDVIFREGDKSDFSERLARIKDCNSRTNIILGTVASLDVSYKGQEFVIKSIPKMLKYGLQVKYMLAGRGKGNRLKGLVKKMGLEGNVIFLGEVPFSEITTFYKGIDIYIQPSLQEGLPRAMVEAMHAGCPCIGSKTGGIPELLEPAMILAALDPVSISQKIVFLWQNALEKQAIRNHQFSKSFEFDALNRKRIHFFGEFVSNYFPDGAGRIQIQG